MGIDCQMKMTKDEVNGNMTVQLHVFSQHQQWTFVLFNIDAI